MPAPLVASVQTLRDEGAIQDPRVPDGAFVVFRAAFHGNPHGEVTMNAPASITMGQFMPMFRSSDGRATEGAQGNPSRESSARPQPEKTVGAQERAENTLTPADA